MSKRVLMTAEQAAAYLRECPGMRFIGAAMTSCPDETRTDWNNIEYYDEDRRRFRFVRRRTLTRVDSVEGIHSTFARCSADYFAPVNQDGYFIAVDPVKATGPMQMALMEDV